MPKTPVIYFKDIASFLRPLSDWPNISLFVWYIIVCINKPESPIWTGNLSDPDDYLYFVQAIDWLRGQSWYDLIQHRLNPPYGTYIHYSHLLSAFYAAIIYILNLFMPYQKAAITMSVVVPPLYLIFLLFSLSWLTKKFVDKKWSGLTAYFVLFSQTLLYQYTPGHIDHHGLEALIAVLAFCSLVMMSAHRQIFIWSSITGFLLAFGLVVGLEILPFVGLFCCCVGLWAVLEGGKATKSALYMGTSLFVFSVFFLLLTRPAALLLKPDLPVYSIVYVILTGSIAACYAGVAISDKTLPAFMRYVVGGSLACLLGLAFLHLFPQLKEGPYGGVDPILQKLIYIVGDEAWPIIGNGPLKMSWMLPYLFQTILGAFASACMVAYTQDRTRRYLWAMACLIISIFTILAALYQNRLFYYAQTFSIVALTCLAHHDWRCLSSNKKNGRIFHLVRLGILFLIGPITFITASSLFSEAASDGTVVERHMMSGGNHASGCDMHALADVLSDPKGYGRHPLLIMNTINEGAELLFRTPHKVLAGPYHMNVDGNLDGLEFFATSDSNIARTIAEKRGASLVVICNQPSQLSIYEEMKEDVGAKGTIFVEQLTHNQIPSWLKPIPSPNFNSLLLFEFRQNS